MNKKIYYLALFLFVLTSCKRSFTNEKEYYAFINKDESGFVKTKKVGGINYTLKFLPPEVLAHRELQTVPVKSQQAKDSLIHLYENSVTFLLKISYDENIDLMKGSVSNYEEYNQLVMDMNFSFGEYLELSYGNKSIKPVLAKMEDTYGLQPYRTIYIVFPKTPEMEQQESFKVTFTDFLFDTGINHFQYNAEKIFDRPEFQI